MSHFCIYCGTALDDPEDHNLCSQCSATLGYVDERPLDFSEGRIQSIYDDETQGEALSEDFSDEEVLGDA